MTIVAPSGDIEILPDPSALADHAAAWLRERVMLAGESPSVCLSGGDMPRLIYQRLAERYLESFPWDRVHWFWGDERFVPTTDPRNNFRMVWQALFERTPVPARNLHPITTDGVSLDEAAAAYEQELKRFYGAEELDPDRPLFDAAIFGLGPDGHTASLFPGAPVLEERTRWVVPVVGFSDEPRITLTYPVLESSAHAVFVVAGEETRPVLTRIWQGTSDVPAARVRPIGSLDWFLDRGAAPVRD